MSSSNLLSFFQSITQFNHQYRIRSLVVFYGSYSWCEQQSKVILPFYSQWLFISSLHQLDASSVTVLNDKKFRTQLGSEWDALIYDATQELNPDIFGALSGCIKAGGIFVLYLDPQLSNISQFQKWFLYQIRQDPFTSIFAQEDSHKISDLDLLEKKLMKATSVKNESLKIIDFAHYATQDQQSAVQAIIKTITGHRNRPLVITADRGRGKTVSLGLACQALLAKRDLKILVTAPKPSAVENLFKQLTEKEKRQVYFIAPDLLIQTHPSCDLLLVDEAAAIPVPLLVYLATTYKRMVFSSTVHGYEGAGRGFTIKFIQKLKTIAPQFRALHLNEPIRWAVQCPLESFTFKALLLKVKIPTIEQDYAMGNIHMVKFDPSIHFKLSQSYLEQAFAILVAAHYQTSPNDLKNLLDLDEVDLWLAIEEDLHKVVGALLYIQEGGITSELCESILNGKRRIKGNLIAQSLMTHSGMSLPGQLKSWRIMRIAVHPQLQRQGIASVLIQHLKIQARQNTQDYISTSYGATPSLMAFWLKQSFSTLTVGLTRDAASGTYSVQSMYPLSDAAKKVQERLRKYLRFNLPYLLSTQHIHISPMLATQLAKDIQFYPVSELIEEQIKEYQNEHIGADLIGASLNQWLWYQLSIMANKEKNSPLIALSSSIKGQLLIERILFAKNWPDLLSLYGKKLAISGKKQMEKKLLEIIKEIK